MRSIYGLLFASFFFVASLNTYAFTNQLGPDAVLVPYVEMPFVTSTLVKNTGERLPDGSCQYPIHLELTPGMLQDNEVFVRVLRAFDPVQCEEILEQGIALKPLPEAAQSTTVDFVEETLKIVGQDLGGGGDVSASSSTSQEASGYIKYTDGRHPLIKPFADNIESWDGKTVSEVAAYISGEWDDSNSCPYTYTLWKYWYGTDKGDLWEEEDFESDYITASCDQFELDVNVRHKTDEVVDLVNINCSEGVAITYKPVTFHVGRDGFKDMDSEGVIVTGPIENCREYLVKYEVFE